MDGWVGGWIDWWVGGWMDEMFREGLIDGCKVTEEDE